jgi:hypothetical protein
MSSQQIDISGIGDIRAAERLERRSTGAQLFAWTSLMVPPITLRSLVMSDSQGFLSDQPNRPIRNYRAVHRGIIRL